MSWQLYTKQAQRYRKLRTTEQSTLFAKIRSARSSGFKRGDLAKVTLPEIPGVGYIEHPQEEFFALLLHKANREEKRQWVLDQGFRPEPVALRQCFWLAIVEEEVTLVLEGFLTLEQRNHDK